MTFDVNLSEIAKTYHQSISAWIQASSPDIEVIPGQGTFGSAETAADFKAWCIVANGSPAAGDRVKILGSSGSGRVYRIDGDRAWVWDLENYWEDGLEMIAHWFDVTQLIPIPPGARLEAIVNKTQRIIQPTEIDHFLDRPVQKNDYVKGIKFYLDYAFLYGCRWKVLEINDETALIESNFYDTPKSVPVSYLKPLDASTHP